ncbi:glucose-1-phosphate adenylyltransferase subunit GlgD [Collinsella intestinalis]|uniref:glucose-1-phosphate adenylyltransferase subunit GlgD n=1 Tax=Collinsella intestinalis TaxID=147207 RepID=UPI0019593840|nr:glucose-1-phosphate adenylyltransferase subunit GlgD [Collinsella intestinalis]MBM6941523.1 glucose-1-phosphate adenylyltransferase subunit GlgD [Collinsella intestinalis]
MINRKAIGYITANYAGSEPSKLIQDRPVAAVPFLGRYRLIDFPLSNMTNAGIRTVGLVMPGNWRSISDHVGHGKDWMLDRKSGGLFTMPGNPYGTTKQGMRFLLRDIISNRELFERADTPYVVMMGANIIFNMDLNEIIDAHERSGVGVTMVYVKAERHHNDANRLVIGDAGRVQQIEPGCEYGDNKFIDCFVINRDLLIDIINNYANADYLDFFEAIAGDFARIDVCSYEYKGLAIGIFDERTYYQRSMELLTPDIYDQLFPIDRPIRTKAHDAAPAKYYGGCNAQNSFISAGCKIYGTVRNSILSRGVVVESGANVSNSIIMFSCVIKRGARVENAILDKNNVVPENTEYRGTPDAILVMGKGDHR